MKNNKLSKSLAIVIFVAMMVTLVLCSGMSAIAKNSKKSAGDVLSKIKSSGQLVIGTSADFPPYEFHKVANGKDQIVGFDINIAQEIAKNLGVKLVIKDMNFDGLLAALATGNIDMVIAGMNPTKERAKKVDFSKIYYRAEQTVMVRTADASKYKSLADFTGKIVGAQKGSTQETLAKEQIKGAQIKSISKITDLVLELKNSKIDGLVLESPVAKSYVSKNTDIKVSGIYLKLEENGSAIAVKKNNPGFIQEINKTLTKLMNSKSIDKFVVQANNLVEK